MLGVVADGPIDRKSLVQSFNPLVVKVDPFSALSVGNGEFAFTADITGLQTFLEDYHTDFPLCTASHWGWHTSPMPAGVNPADFRYQNFDTYGRPVGYATERNRPGSPLRLAPRKSASPASGPNRTDPEKSRWFAGQAVGCDTDRSNAGFMDRNPAKPV
jgi:hypothetical protein